MDSLIYISFLLEKDNKYKIIAKFVLWQSSIYDIQPFQCSFFLLHVQKLFLGNVCGDTYGFVCDFSIILSVLSILCRECFKEYLYLYLTMHNLCMYWHVHEYLSTRLVYACRHWMQSTSFWGIHDLTDLTCAFSLLMQ